MDDVWTWTYRACRRCRAWLLPALALMAAPALAADEDDTRICLPSRGADAATPPAVRLNGSYQVGNSGDPLRDMLAGATAPGARYLPGAMDKAAGPARWLFEGVAEAQAGRHDEAERQFTRCSTEAAQARDVVAEAACSNNLGAVAAARGRYADARTWFERSAQQYRAALEAMPSQAEIKRREQAYAARMQSRAEALSAEFKASAPRDRQQPVDLAQLQAMRERLLRLQTDAPRDPDALASRRDQLVRMGSQAGLELVALNLANVAFALGQWEESLGHLRQALAGYEGRLSCRPAALDELLRLRERLPKKDEVTALVERYRRAVNPKAEAAQGGLYELGVLALGAASDVKTAAAPARPAATPARADEERLQPKLFADPLSATSEAGLQDLLARAARDEREGRLAAARRGAGIVALRAQAAGRAEIEATAQSLLMRLEAAAGRPAVAVFHGKRAANLLQELRSGAAALPRNARRTYLREREQAYSRLAQLLMQSRRLVEAERVLQMLKEDEGRQFIEGGGRGAYASLPETPPEAALRARMAQAAQALRRSDEERVAVGADRTYAMLLTIDRAGLEQQRLRAATEWRAWLDPAAKSGAAELEKALRAMPLEYQQAFAALFADGGQRLGATLRAMNDDAPQFKGSAATPQQLAAAADALRRTNDLRSALAPVLEAMRREPSPTVAAMMEHALDPAELQRQQRERVQQVAAQLQAAQRSPQAAQPFQDLVQATQREWAGPQTASGLVTQAYMAAMAGREDLRAVAGVEKALQGASPEVLDSFLNLVRDQGRQFQAGARAAPQLQARLAAQAPAVVAPPETLAARLRELLARRKDAAAVAASAPAAAAAEDAAPPAGDASVVARVQARLEAAVDNARRTAGPSTGATQQQRLAMALPAPAKKREAMDLPAIALAEPLGRLWRIDLAREALEERSFSELGAAAERLQASSEAVPAAADESGPALAALGVPTALLYYLPHDGGVDALLVGPQGRQSWHLPLPRADLDPLVQAFAAALRDPSTDPRPAARALYDRLFAPVAAALAAARVQVVALSLSGSLRFVPFAALHDGQAWLAERYAFAMNPGGRLADVLKPASGAWQVAAFGASKGGANLPPLQGVTMELDMIVRQGERGALPGRQWLDGAFTAQALRTALGSGSQVVHIASHFQFEAGDAAQSFLLLGDGQRLSLQDLGGPGYRFDRTELVTLSACQTGVSGDDAFGQEVDGLAALLMAQGAPSVLASLWQVADGSTAQLMGTMYGLHAQRLQRPLGRAQALQQAQLAMIRGSALPSAREEGQPQRGIDRPQAAGAARAGALPRGAHPYHWAPFVLMGSWL